MGIPNIFQTGRSGMNANKAAIAVAGHNISNAGTEGFSRQRVETTADERLRVATQMLIPRTDRNVAGGEAWLDHVRAMAGNRDQAKAYLRATAMLDMVATSGS